MKTIEELEAELETVTRERDEARAEVESLTDERDELLKAYAKAYDEWDHSKYSRAEVAVAYRRGAEAMRERCASAMHPIIRSMISRTDAAQTIRALPIPEEP